MSREHENWFLNSHLSAVTMWVGHHRIAYKHRHIETLCCYNDGKAVIAITSLPIGKYLKMRLQVFNIFFPAPSDLLCQLWLQQLSDYPEGFDKCPFRGSHSQWCGLAQDCRPILLRPQVSAKIFYFPNLREGKKLRVLLLPGMTSSGREFSTSWTAWSPPWWRTGSGGSSTWSPPFSGGGGGSRTSRGNNWSDNFWQREGLRMELTVYPPHWEKFLFQAGVYWRRVEHERRSSRSLQRHHWQHELRNEVRTETRTQASSILELIPIKESPQFPEDVNSGFEAGPR